MLQVSLTLELGIWWYLPQSFVMNICFIVVKSLDATEVFNFLNFRVFKWQKKFCILLKNILFANVKTVESSKRKNTYIALLRIKCSRGLYFIKKKTFITSNKITGQLVCSSTENNNKCILLYSNWNWKQHQLKEH